MKNFKLYSCAAMIAVASMFTSCMEQSNKTSGATFGIISTMDNIPFDNFAKTPSGNITSNNAIFDKASSGDCCLFAYGIDFDNQPAGHPANYVDATITEYIKIEQSYARSSNDNESTYTPDPQEISFSAVSAKGYIENKLFILAEYKQAKGQINNYNLLYNLDSTFNENNQKVYNILFTAARTGTVADAEESTFEYLAFDIARLVEQAKSEATSGSTSTTLQFKLKYINKLTTEEGKDPVEWGETVVQTIYLPVEVEK